MRKLMITCLLIGAFAAWPRAQQLAPSHGAEGVPAPSDRVVVRVNGVALDQRRFEAALNALIPFESFHRNVDPVKLDKLRRQALDRIVDDELVYQEGVRLGVRAGEQAVQADVATVQRKYGTHAALVNALARSGATMADLRREVRRALIIKATLERQVTARCEVTRAEAERFFRSNPDRFVIPEQLHLYGITIGVQPSATMREWDEARHRAEDVRMRIKNGESFQDLARTYSTDPSRTSGGDMGFLHRGALSDEFDRATRGLAIATPSDVVQSLYGFHVVEITEIRPPQRKTYAAVAAGLRRDLASTRCESVRTEWIAGLRERGTVVPSGAGL